MSECLLNSTGSGLILRTTAFAACVAAFVPRQARKT